MKYIKRFAQHADYEAYMGGGVFLPNVSACDDDEPNVMHYNPWREPYNEILYKAPAKLSETKSTGTVSGLHVNSFNTTIKSHTFENGQGKIVFDDDVTSMGNYAFFKCSGMTFVTIPNSVTSIGGYAFGYCSKLSSITIPNSVTSVGGWAFQKCSGLTSVTIGSSVTSIESYAFEGCRSLTSVTIPNSVTSIGQSAFSVCSGLTSITIGSSVTSIGEYSFQRCSNLTSITIPNSVTSIGRSAFDGCSGLTTMTIEATTPPTLGNTSAISTATTTIYVPSESVNAYKRATNWSSFADKIQAIQ